MTARDVIDHLRSLNSYIITLGRLNFAELLLQDSINSKLLCAQKGYNLINQASNIETVLLKFLNEKKGTVKWDHETCEQINNSITTNNTVLLWQLKSEYESYCSEIISLLQKNFNDDLLITQLSGCLDFLSNLFVPKDNTAIVNVTVLNTRSNRGVEKVLSGPAEMKIDKIFEPSYNILENPIPEFGDTLEENVPYFWSLSLREILASELCALSIIEYDNLPLQFYWDFSKQSYDEARHSRIYLDLSISFFDVILKSTDKNTNLYYIITQFNLNRKGLPVPKEKNMYEAILNAELEERLILINILTEAPAIGRLSKKMQTGICTQYPEIKRILEFDKIDEIFHAGIGNYWLKYLISDRIERKQKIEDTKILRGFLLLSSLAEYSNFELAEMAAELTRN